MRSVVVDNSACDLATCSAQRDVEASERVFGHCGASIRHGIRIQTIGRVHCEREKIKEEGSVFERDTDVGISRIRFSVETLSDVKRLIEVDSIT